MVRGQRKIAAVTPPPRRRYVDGIDAVGEVEPELPQVGRLGEHASHPHHGDIFVLAHLFPSLPLRITSGVRRSWRPISAMKAATPSSSEINSTFLDAYNRRSSGETMPPSHGPQLMHKTRPGQRCWS